jgi:cysteine-rich repeat protein
LFFARGAIAAGAVDFDPADNIYRSSFEASTCPNALVEDAEQCDDGNIIAADGCAGNCRVEAGFACTGTPSTCAVPAISEIEPNNSTDMADFSGVVFGARSTVLGAINPLGDLDYFRVSVSDVFKVARFESFAPSPGDCTGGATTTLRLRDAAGAQIVADTAASGISGCAALVFGLAPDTYYIQIEETGNNALITNYALEAFFVGDFGAESEALGASGANDTAAAAENALLGTREGVVFGDHSLSTDVDYYAVELPAGAGIRAEIIEGNRQVATCESQVVDSLLTLYGADGVTQKASDDDSGRGFCSLIDGTGSSPKDLNARNTTGAAQTWYLAVRSSSVAAPGSSSFTYRLAVTVR